MGLTQIKQTIIGSNTYYSYDEIKQKIKELNEQFKQSAPKLHFNIQLKHSELKYDHQNWLKSLVPGTISIKHSVRPSQLIQQQNQKQDGTIQQHIVLSIKDVNNAHQYMKHMTLKKKEPTPTSNKHKQKMQQQSSNSKIKKNIIKEKQINDIQNSVYDVVTNTPNQNEPTTLTKEECCICLQKTPSMVLPCSHSFCDNCTFKYIIQAQQKKCPQCRRQFVGSRSTVQRSIYTVVQDDQEVLIDKDQIYEQVRQYLLQLLSNLNSRIVQNIRPFIRQFSKKE